MYCTLIRLSFPLFVILAMLRIASYNVNGMRNVSNFERLVGLMNDNHYDIMLIQETFWNNEWTELLKRKFIGEIYYSNASNDRRGVAALIKNNLKDAVSFVDKDDDGRFMHIKCNINDKLLNIFNIYAPNIASERYNFFNYVNNKIGLIEHIIIAGDFNVTLSAIDKYPTKNYIPDKSSAFLKQCMANKRLEDIWRWRYPMRKQYSRRGLADSMLTQSRIDYFLLSTSLKPFVTYIGYSQTSKSDHSIVNLLLDFNCQEKGPGSWVLNNSVLIDEDYQNGIANLIEEQRNSDLYSTSFLIWWDNLKYAIKSYSQRYCRQKSYQKREKMTKVQFQLEKELSKNYVNAEYIAQLEYDLKTIEENVCMGAILRSKAQWSLEGERSTHFFLGLERHRQTGNTINTLYNENGEILTDTFSILNRVQEYYTELYAHKGTDENERHKILSTISNDVPESDQHECDSNVTTAEIKTSLFSMKRNKSPGRDGITTEFYRCFYHIFEPLFLKLINEIEKEGTLSRTMKNGMITLIYKKGDKQEITNWRPITLLNVDYKVFAKVMANRLKHVLPKIINQNQTCCVPGRDISDNVANIRDIIEYANYTGIEGYLLKIDQQKAFDMVAHEYLFEILSRFGFGDRFQKWIKIMYTEIYSAVKNNGHLTQFFPISRSVRQGCPISAMLYVISAEPLARLVHASTNIIGIEIGDSHHKSLLYQHADDTTITVSDSASLHNALEIMEQYSRSSGGMINYTKSEVMALGSASVPSEIKNKINVKDDSIEILGVCLGRNKTFCNERNWAKKVKNIKMLLGFWKNRDINIKGRAEVINSLLMSKLWYMLNVQPIPEWAITEITKACIDFLWKGAHLVKYKTIIGERKMGGLNIPDIKLKMMSFRLKMLSRYLDDDYDALWTHVFNFFAKKCINSEKQYSILFMKLPKSILKCVPQYYQEILLSWHEFTKHGYVEINDWYNIVNQPIFHNPKISINNKPLTSEHLERAGITTLKDIIYEYVPGFLPSMAISELVEEYVDDIDTIAIEKCYNILMQVIPHEWQSIINSDKLDHTKKPLEIISDNLIITIRKLKSKIFYNLLRKKNYEEPTSQLFWSNIFQDFELSRIWQVVHMPLKSPELVDLDFRIAHNSIFTMKKLKRIGKVDSDLCPICKKEQETLLHLFLECEKLSQFHEFLHGILEVLFQEATQFQLLNFDYELFLMLGMCTQMTRVNVEFVNIVFSMARLCIYKRRQVAIMHSRIIPLPRYFHKKLCDFIKQIVEYSNSKEKINAIGRLVDYNEIVSFNDGILVFNF